MTELEEKLLGAVEKFKAKIAEKPDYKKELEGWKRSVLIDSGEEKYHFLIEDAQVKDFQAGPMEMADIKIFSDNQTLIGLLDGEISPMKAYAKKQLQLKASLSDVLKIRKFF